MPTCIFCDQDNPDGVTQCELCKGPLPDSATGNLPADKFHQHLRQLLQDNQRIQAVAAYRRRMDVSLSEAVEAIDALSRDQEFNVSSDNADLEWEIIGYLERGEKLGAIKLYRTKTGLGLKDAKDAVEAIEQRMGLAIAPTTGGCLSVILLSASTLGLMVAMMLSNCW